MNLSNSAGNIIMNLNTMVTGTLQSSIIVGQTDLRSEMLRSMSSDTVPSARGETRKAYPNSIPVVFGLLDKREPLSAFFVAQVRFLQRNSHSTGGVLEDLLDQSSLDPASSDGV